MQRNLRGVAALIGLVLLAGCTNPVQSVTPGGPRFNGGSMGSGGRGGTGGTDSTTVLTTTSSPAGEECYEESFNGGSMGSGGFVIVPCPDPAK